MERAYVLNGFLQSRRIFATLNDYVPNSWICFEFKNKSVSLHHYTLKSSGQGAHFFVQWEIEGSNDGSTWKSLDSRNTTRIIREIFVGIPL
jgi:hypothetical protein